MKLNFYTFKKLIAGLYAKDIYYIYSMTIYHFLIILTGLFGIKYNFGVFYVLNLTTEHQNIFALTYDSLLRNMILIAILLAIDCAFLLILMFEFKSFRLNYKKIFLIEMILLSISFFFPVFRDIMYFMSLNTIEIYIVYRILMKFFNERFNFSLFKYAFLTMSYIFILKIILIKPLLAIIELIQISNIINQI